MIKQTLALVGLTLSLSANAAIVDLGNITRDTATGLDWLDLTETNGRSYNDISSKLGSGMEFDGWHYASVAEVQTLWKNMGLTDGTNSVVPVSDSAQYADFISAVDLLGNTANEWSISPGGFVNFDYGSLGFTGASADGLVVGDSVFSAGMYHRVGTDATEIYDSGSIRFKTEESLFLGSYLIAPVPIPAAAWLFGSAMLGLMGVAKRKKA